MISKEKSINEMKERVTVMHIENFTKLLFQVILWTFKFVKEDLLLIPPGESIKEMKERVTVMHIENFTKPLFQVVL